MRAATRSSSILRITITTTQSPSTHCASARLRASSSREGHTPASAHDALASNCSPSRARMEDSPEKAVSAMRAIGRNAAARDEIGRARLKRAIGWIDAVMPRGGNCFRRTLIELALDAGAAEETLAFGLDVGRTGHVAF